MGSRWIEEMSSAERAELRDAGRIGSARWAGPPPKGSQLSAESRLIEYVAHEGNSDAQEDMHIVSDQITKMKLALHEIERVRAFDMLPHPVQDRIKEALRDSR